MNQSNAPVVDAENSEVAEDEIFDALQDVISDVDTFMAGWCKRFDQVVSSCASPAAVEANPADANLHDRIKDFQQEQAKWEAKRKLEAERIQEQADQLTEAWLRLETEQRRFLQMKESHPLATPERRTDAVEQTRDRDRSAIDQQSTRRSVTPNANPLREAAVRQFQRLRREIESSRPNSGQL